MVVRLEGEINGESVVLYRNKDSPASPEVWDAVIPATLNGKYVIGLTAYDEAGNIGYYATYIITVDLASMRVTLEPLDIYATLNN